MYRTKHILAQPAQENAPLPVPPPCFIPSDDAKLEKHESPQSIAVHRGRTRAKMRAQENNFSRRVLTALRFATRRQDRSLTLAP